MLKMCTFIGRSANYFIALDVCEKTNENVQFCKHGKMTVLTLCVYTVVCNMGCKVFKRGIQN